MKVHLYLRFQGAFIFLVTAMAGTSSPLFANGYGIVTTTEIRSASTMLSTFESHKASRGYNVQVFDETDWGGGGLTGDNAAEALVERGGSIPTREAA